jgi:carbon dioxide concentrating mechanism protein CcmN
MVGQGKIGGNACIGAATTVFNCSVAPEQVVPAGSILGDSSRQFDETQNQPPTETSSDTTVTNHPQAEPEKPKEKVVTSTQFSATAFVDFKQESTSVSPPTPTPKSQSPPVAETPLVTNSTPEETTLPGSQETNSQEPEPIPANAENSQIFGTQIYGQGSINRLLTTLFPHRQPLSNQNSEDAENSSE